MRILIHAGNPKAYSTSIQELLQLNHGQSLFYIGFRPRNEAAAWYPNQIEARFLNYDLRVTNRRAFCSRVNEYREYFRRKAESTHLPLFISSENLSMRLNLEEIDIHEKFYRLCSVFGGDFEVTYLLVFRPIFASLRSIYREFLKQGYNQSFSHFQTETLALAECNFLSSLFPADLCEYLASQTNSKVEAVFPDSADPGIKIVRKLCDWLSEFKTAEFPKLNASNQGRTEEEVLALNRAHSPLVDSSGLMEMHRVLWHLPEENDYKWIKLRGRRECRDSKSEGREAAINREPHPDFVGCLRERFQKDEAVALKIFDAPVYQMYQSIWDHCEEAARSSP